MSTVTIVRDFILNELHWDEARGTLTPDYPLIENHVVDSMGLLMLVSFVEERFGVQLADEELVPEHFGTITAIVRLIEKKVSERSRVSS
ncbi:MAG: acyl carrier protein [Acidimicrobiia bacterium]